MLYELGKAIYLNKMPKGEEIMRRRLFCLLTTLTIILSSCDFEVIPRRIEPIDDDFNEKSLDVHKLLEKKSMWKALGVKNYTFTYRFCDRMNKTGRYREYKGIVVVEDGKGKLRFDKRFRIPSKYNPDERKFFITSIEDVFDNILEDYLRLKKKKDEGQIDYLDASYQWYDSDYFFLKEVQYTPFTFSSSYGPRVMKFEIVDFNVF